MDSFYLIVLGVATLVLILMLAFLGWTMSKSKKGEKYPPIVKTCPDNWKVDSTVVPGKVLCKRPESSNYKYGDSNLTTYMTSSTSPGYVSAERTNYINFADDKWTACGKRDWAKKYSVKWDSVDSANYCE